jgi:hypothetical protein
MNDRNENLIERVLSRHRERPLAGRAEIRRVLDRHRGSKTVVALSVRPRPVTVQAVSQWLTGRTISRPIWEAAHAIAEELLAKERERSKPFTKLAACAERSAL